jgi:hypothetical protein
MIIYHDLRSDFHAGPSKTLGFTIDDFGWIVPVRGDAFDAALRFILEGREGS